MCIHSVRAEGNRRSLLDIASRLSGIQALHPPSAPGATIIMGLLPDGGRPVTFAACSLDAEHAYEACVAEAAEYLAQNDPRAAALVTAMPDNAVLGFDMALPAPVRQWLPAIVYPTARFVSVPTALCCYLPENAEFDISTGCAAGKTPEDAILHAICEIIERDATRRWWQGQHPARAFETSHPAMLAGMEWIAAARHEVSDRRVSLLDISGDAVIPVVAAISLLDDGSGFVAGIAAHPDPSEAAISALREMVQMEFGLFLATMKHSRSDFSLLDPADQRHLVRAQNIEEADERLVPNGISTWEKPLTSVDSAVVAERLESLGHRVYLTRLSEDPYLPVMRALIGGVPIRRRSNALTPHDQRWNAPGNADLY